MLNPIILCIESPSCIQRSSFPCYAYRIRAQHHGSIGVQRTGTLLPRGHLDNLSPRDGSPLARSRLEVMIPFHRNASIK
jgi:hypothetical protein